MLLLKKNKLEIDSAKRLVKADEVATFAKAAEIIAAAEAESARIAEEAKKAYEAERKRGYEDGLAEAKEKILGQKLDLVAESIDYMQSVENEMAGIVMKALRKCVSDLGDETMTLQVVRKAMEAIVRAQRQVTIRVPADKVQVVKDRLGEVLKDFPAVNFTEVIEGPRLTGVACVVETAAGMVESSVDSQLKAFEKSIKKRFKS